LCTFEFYSKGDALK